MPIFKTNKNISIYYQLINENAQIKQTIVLIGGLTRDHTIWRKEVPLLKNDYQILLIDNRDVGQSTTNGSQYTIPDLAEDIAELIITLDIAPVHIVGHSMGGFIGFYLATNYPKLVKTLVLCSTIDIQPQAATDYLNARIDFINKQPNATTASKDNIIAVLDKLYCEHSLKNQAMIDEIINHETNNPHPQTSESFKRQAIACINHDARNLLTKIQCPTLVITGEYDKMYTPEKTKTLASKIANAKSVIIPNAAHMVQIEQPEALAEAIKEFCI